MSQIGFRLIPKVFNAIDGVATSLEAVESKAPQDAGKQSVAAPPIGVPFHSRKLMQSLCFLSEDLVTSAALPCRRKGLGAALRATVLCPASFAA